MPGLDYSAVSTNLVRANLWSDQLKDVLVDTLMGQQFVNWLTNFPDGTTFNIPSISEIPMRDVNGENDPVVYDSLQSGNFSFIINKYVESATYITDKAKQESFVADQLIASFIPKMKRAIEENLETGIFELANSQLTNNCWFWCHKHSASPCRLCACQAGSG
jgi:molecular chaperone DnaK (HSP70)